MVDMSVAVAWMRKLVVALVHTAGKADSHYAMSVGNVDMPNVDSAVVAVGAGSESSSAGEIADIARYCSVVAELQVQVESDLVEANFHELEVEDTEQVVQVHCW